MRVRKMVKNLTEPERDQFEAYLEKKLENLRPLLEAHYADEDTVQVSATIEKHDKHTAFDFEYVFELPKKRLVSREVKHSVTESMDKATEKVERQLVDHLNRLVHN